MDHLKGRKLIILTTSNKEARPFLTQLWDAGIECYSVTTPEEFARALYEYNPDFVMLPFDFPKHQSITALIQLVKREFRSEIIGYIAKDSAAMITRLAESGLKYTFNPPLTANLILRELKKIVEDNHLKFIRLDEDRAEKKPTLWAAAQKIAESGPAPAPGEPVDFYDDLDYKIQQSLDEVCKIATTEAQVKTLKNVTQLNLIPFFNDQGDKARGIIVMVNSTDGDNSTFTPQFRADFADLVKHFLKIEMPGVRTGPPARIEVEEFDFVACSLSQAQLVKTAYHGGDEIGVAYFAKSDLGAELKLNPSLGLHSAPIEGFEKSVLLPFEVFTELANKKYLIGERGTALKGKQLETLKRSGLKYLHIEATVTDQYHLHAAENFIRKSVASFLYAMMNREVRRLMNVTTDQQRMKDELSSAGNLQDFLFPNEHFVSPDIEVRGITHRASEVGGDWWYYSQIGSKFYLWIGDATGHGVSAALVTTAAKSASAVLATFPDLPLVQVMALLNNSIYAAGGAKVNMTFFLGKIDLTNGEFKYTNASHTPPVLFSNTEKIYTKANLKFFDGPNGPRLGENPKSSWPENTTSIQPGDRLLLYTDGVIEMENEAGEVWGERKFMQALTKAVNENSGITGPMQAISRNIEQFRRSRLFVDDATYFMVQYKPGARRVK